MVNMVNKDVGKKIPIGVPTVIGLVSQFVVCILFGFRYTNGYESEPIRGYLVNSYDFLLIISSVLITLVSLFLLIGLAVATLEKLRPLGILLGGILVASCAQVGAGFVISASFASLIDVNQVYSTTIYILCSIFTLISGIFHFAPIFIWLKD